jgi:NADPH-dependent 2,4-dienoyl-CoA reductase/sulfur reductase-like enzyme
MRRFCPQYHRLRHDGARRSSCPPSNRGSMNRVAGVHAKDTTKVMIGGPEPVGLIVAMGCRLRGRVIVLETRVEGEIYQWPEMPGLPANLLNVSDETAL